MKRKGKEVQGGARNESERGKRNLCEKGLEVYVGQADAGFLSEHKAAGFADTPSKRNN